MMHCKNGCYENVMLLVVPLLLTKCQNLNIATLSTNKSHLHANCHMSVFYLLMCPHDMAR
jgi:hypothetical protein